MLEARAIRIFPSSSPGLSFAHSGRRLLLRRRKVVSHHGTSRPCLCLAGCGWSRRCLKLKTHERILKLRLQTSYQVAAPLFVPGAPGAQAPRAAGAPHAGAEALSTSSGLSATTVGAVASAGQGAPSTAKAKTRTKVPELKTLAPFSL